MRLDFLANPELVMDRRGDKFLRMFYKKTLSCITFHPEGPMVSGVIGMSLNADEVTANHAVMCKRFVQDKGQIYYLPKEFLSALSKMKKDIPLDCLPDKFIGYFQLPQHVLKDEEDYIDGAYVYVGPQSGIGRSADEAHLPPEARCISVSYVTTRRVGGIPVIGKFYWPLTRPLLIDDMRKIKSKDLMNLTDPFDIQIKDFSEERLAVYLAFINACLYVHSEDPDIIKLRPLGGLTKHQKESARKESPIENRCTLPVQLLNWEYYGRTYSMDKIFVDSFPRWQRCGPGLTRHKYIWVRPFERHPKNVKE